MRYRYLFEKKNIKKLFYVCRHNKMNKSIEDSYDSIGKNVRVFGFYHAYCLCEDWHELVSEQFEHLRTSGLYERMDKIYCSVICDDSQLSEFQTIGGGKCVVVFHSEDPTFFEFPALITLQKKAIGIQEGFVGFYFHTKGATLKPNPKVYAVDRTWRKMCEFFILDHWRLGVAAILRGYDAYGVNYEEVEGDYFRLVSCNFFWFRSEYVKTLDNLEISHEKRGKCEIWLLSKTHNVYCPFWFTGNLRRDSVPTELYLPCSSRLRKTIVIVKTYFSRYIYIFQALFKKAEIQIIR